MSADFLVFDPAEAPRHRDDFLRWWGEKAQWGQAHGYDDPTIANEPLQRWFRSFEPEWPRMNGGSGPVDYDNPRLTDYTIDKDLIYLGVAWSQAEAAYRAVRESAAAHKLGFFNIAGGAEDGEIILPGRDRRAANKSSESSQGPDQE